MSAKIHHSSSSTVSSASGMVSIHKIFNSKINSVGTMPLDEGVAHGLPHTLAPLRCDLVVTTTLETGIHVGSRRPSKPSRTSKCSHPGLVCIPDNNTCDSSDKTSALDKVNKYSTGSESSTVTAQTTRVSSERSSVLSEKGSCRICWNDDKLEKFIQPCQCIGSSALVHSSCLKTWFSKSMRFSCEVCQHKYEMKQQSKPVSQWTWCWGKIYLSIFVIILLTTPIAAAMLVRFQHDPNSAKNNTNATVKTTVQHSKENVTVRELRTSSHLEAESEDDSFAFTAFLIVFYSLIPVITCGLLIFYLFLELKSANTLTFVKIGDKYEEVVLANPDAYIEGENFSIY